MATANLHPSGDFAVVKRTNDPNMNRDIRKHTFAYTGLLSVCKYHAVQFSFSLSVCSPNAIWT